MGKMVFVLYVLLVALELVFVREQDQGKTGLQYLAIQFPVFIIKRNAVVQIKTLRQLSRQVQKFKQDFFHPI
jgi:uncharacterized membrane protein YadS